MSFLGDNVKDDESILAQGPKMFSSGHTQIEQNISHIPPPPNQGFALALQMSYAVILVALLAMMPQLMPKQRTDSLIGPCHFC